MRFLKSDRLFVLGAPALFLALAVFGALLVNEPQHAAAADEECNVVIALDKSDSILPENLDILKANIVSLIERLGDENISIAFWAFSHEDDDVDYNLPRHDYVPTNVDGVGLLEFEDSLPKVEQLRGQTDYAQAFGYSVGNPDLNAITRAADFTLTSNNNVNSIRSRADVFVLLTDGAPNYPGTSNDNQYARWAGRTAREQYPENVAMIGGYITNDPSFQPTSLREVINGDPNDGTRVGPVSYDGQANEQIYSYVSEKLLEVCPDVDRADYSLKPIVQKSVDVVQVDDVLHFDYFVDKEADTDNDATRSSSWQIFDVVIDPGVPGSPLHFNFSSDDPAEQSSAVCANSSGAPYCNNIPDCGAILARLTNRGPDTKCDQIAAGNGGSGVNTPFNHGMNSFYPNGRNVTVGNYPLGTRICSILMLRTASLGVSYRASRADCAVIAKAPLTQVHGGDLRTGRHFVEDTSPQDQASDGEDDDKPGVYTSRFKISKNNTIVPNGRTYGSWVEYGVLAPGPVQRIASLSGYAGEHGGYDGAVNTSSCDTNLNKLTFANEVAGKQSCGETKGELGAIPDIVSAVTAGPVIDTATYTHSAAQPLAIGENSPSSTTGIYANETADANFYVGESRLFKTPAPATKGRAYIVYVPHGTVTITGNILFNNLGEPYGSIYEIPQMIIVARDIAIQEGVTQVNAWLIAAGDGETGGKLATCAGYAGRFSGAVCKQPLTINGPVMARDLALYRTTVREDSCEIEAIEDCADVGNPAEIMNLSGSSLLWTRGFNQNPSSARTTSTIELPPYF